MKCPHCQNQLPTDYGAVHCPACGKDLPGGTPRKPVNWLRFLIFLLLPPLLTLISAALMRHVIWPTAQNEGLTFSVGLFGGIIGGLGCGIVVGSHSDGIWIGRVFLSILCAAIMIPICITLCSFGCGLGGYNLRIGG